MCGKQDPDITIAIDSDIITNSPRQTRTRSSMHRAREISPSSGQTRGESGAQSITERTTRGDGKRAASRISSSSPECQLAKQIKVETQSSTNNHEQTPGFRATRAPDIGPHNSNTTSPIHRISSALVTFGTQSRSVSKYKIQDDANTSLEESTAPSDLRHASRHRSSNAVHHVRDNGQHPSELPITFEPKASKVWPKSRESFGSVDSDQTGADKISFDGTNPKRSTKTLADNAAARMRQRRTGEEVRNLTQPIPVKPLVVESMVTNKNSSVEWKTLSEFYDKLWQKIEGTTVSKSRCKYDDLNHSGQMSKLELYHLVQAVAARCAPDIAISHRNQLRDALDQAFDLILVPAPKHFEPEYGINELLDSWADDQFCQGFAPQSATSPSNATRKFPSPQIKQIFRESSSTDLGSNFLDLENRSGISFCSQAIDKVDLVKLIIDQGRHEPFDLARQEKLRSSYPNQDLLLKEWLIVTKGPSASYFHVDTAGQATCILGIQGSKTWCVPRGPWHEVCSEFQAGGTMYTKWSKGIRAVSVEEGTTIFQAPGTVHAVLTPQDCLVAGRFFYTASLFARSIKYMERFFLGTIYSNDEMKEADYLRLQLIIDKVHDETFFNTQQRREIWQATHELLQSLSWKPKVNANPKKSHYKRRKESSKESPKVFQDQQDIGELDQFEWPGEEYIKYLNKTMPGFGSAVEMGCGGARNQFVTSCVSLWARFVDDYRD